MNNQTKRTSHVWYKFLSIASFCTIVSSNVAAIAQVTPDNTLPNNSEVKVEGNKSTIEGGTQTGSNLFHSFEKFGVPTGGEAHFNNAADIQNIISRVTGKSISDIDGLIKANGAANLFLINANGIVLGENARLDIGGSFVGSTADSFKFTDGKEFSAKNPQSEPLLTMNVPVGLQYGANPGNIQVKGDGQGIRKTSELIDTQTALRVQPNQTLALVGGDVSLEGATLKTAGGRIELGSVAGEGLVNLTPTEKGFFLGYDAVENGGNIELSQQAAIDASGEGGGDIQVWGKGIKLIDGSRVEASTLGLGNGGTLVVNALESVEIIGAFNSQFPSALFASVYSEAKGKGGNLTIKTNTLLVKDGAQVSTGTDGKGKGGNLTVDAQDMQLIGESKDGQFGSGLSAQANNKLTGDAGDLTITTNTLLVKDGALVSAGTFGKGKGGNLTVNAQDVQLIGENKDGQFGSDLFVTAEKNSTGDAGDLTITANTLLVKDGAQVSASTFGEGKGGNLTVDAHGVQLIGTSEDGQFPSGLFAGAEPNSTGDAGDLTITTNTLLVKGGAQVSPGTFGEGKGGNLTVNAELVQLIGNNEADVPPGDDFAPSGLLASSHKEATGKAGDLTINTGTLLVKDVAAVAVESFGKGVAGNLYITADSVQLDNGIITASTRSANGGNITLDIANLLLMRGDSQIRTTAGIGGASGNGGNININTPDGFIIATPEENSDITANAFEGNGGRVKIDATGIFGIEPRSRKDLVNLLGTDDPKELDADKLLTNDITAISQQNPDLSGSVEIITPQTDPNSASIESPTTPIETEIVDACSTPGYAQSSFTITGTGSLPWSSSEPLTGRLNRTRLATLEGDGEIKPQRRQRRQARKEEPQVKQIVEARGWVRTKDGKIILVAHAPQKTNYQPRTNSGNCELIK